MLQKLFQVKRVWKKVHSGILMSNKTEVKVNQIRRDKKRYVIIVKGSINAENIIILNNLWFFQYHKNHTKDIKYAK